MKANDQSFTENMFPYFCGVYDVINLREWVLLTYLVFLYLPSDFDGISTHSWAQSKGSIFLFWHWGTCDVTNDDVIILREWALLTYLVFFYLPSDFREILFYIQVSTVRMLQFSLRHQSLRRLWVFFLQQTCLCLLRTSIKVWIIYWWVLLYMILLFFWAQLWTICKHDVYDPIPSPQKIEPFDCAQLCVEIPSKSDGK